MGRRGALRAAAGLLAALAPGTAPAAADEAGLDRRYRAALDLLYSGQAEDASAGLADLTAAHGDDPVGAYLQALVLCWKVEQRPPSAEIDAQFWGAVDRALALAERRLATDPKDARARFARGAAHGVRSRYHLFRRQARESSRAAVRMRADLLAAEEGGAFPRDVRFGLGLYDYYVDVLPRLAKVLRFLSGMPGGNRRRGLARIEEAQDSLLHDVEVQAQLYDIYAFYEEDPDRALGHIRALHRRYPGWPLWGLKLAEHQRERLGLYAASAAVAREVLEAERRRGAGGGSAAALARLSLTESLLLDGRLEEARRALPEEAGLAPATAARSSLVRGRVLEMDGDREAALVHYRAAAAAPAREVRDAARRALRRAIPQAEVHGRGLVAQARRAREAGRPDEAVGLYRRALAAWPQSQEAALRVVEDDLAHQAGGRVRAALAKLLDQDHPDPPWVSAWARLLEARRLDLAGDRQRALERYEQVLAAPCGVEELTRLAAEGIRQRFQANPGGASPNNIR